MSQCWARSIARPLPRSCDNTGNPSPVGSREYRAETAPVGSADIRLRVLRRGVIPCRPGQATSDHNHADDHLEGYPIRPAWKEIGHGAKRPPRRRCAAAKSATADSSGGELPMNENCGQDRLRSDAAKWLRLIVA
jgi:hypothetical protein